MISFNQLPETLQDIQDETILNSPIFMFQERISLLQYFCRIFEKDFKPNSKTEKHLIMGNSSVGKTHFAYMITLILRKYRKKFCLINIMNTAEFENSYEKYILLEAFYWFYDEIKSCKLLKICYNIAFERLSVGLSNKNFLSFLLIQSIMKAKKKIK